MSTSFAQNDDASGVLVGNFTFFGKTRPLEIEVKPDGHGRDLWFGYSRGFVGTTQFRMSDYGMDFDQLGSASQIVYLTLSVEGIRQ